MTSRKFPFPSFEIFASLILYTWGFFRARRGQQHQKTTMNPWRFLIYLSFFVGTGDTCRLLVAVFCFFKFSEQRDEFRGIYESWNHDTWMIFVAKWLDGEITFAIPNILRPMNIPEPKYPVKLIGIQYPP